GKEGREPAPACIKQGGDFNNAVHIRSFKNPMLDRMVEHNAVYGDCHSSIEIDNYVIVFLELSWS
ncbi:MAG TPA: hypothetical protein VN444_01450, partial [Verrucomicrobiae bacterium]|nr:hypothetical protein [Verrucomicrobiae bacterium]